MHIPEVKLDDLLNDKFDAFSTEMATVCSPGSLGQKLKCRIYIKENPLDHGKIGDGKRYIPDHDSPAHAHVLTADNYLIGFVNITGPRPKTIQDVWEYRKPKTSKLDEYREDIVNWANSRVEDDEGNFIYNWTLVRYLWKVDHSIDRSIK